MKKKIYFLTGMLIIFIIGLIILHNINIAAQRPKKISWTTFAHWGYDKVKDATWEYLDERGYWDNPGSDSYTGYEWKYCHQVMCIHGSNIEGREEGEESGESIVSLIIDINKSGNNPFGATATYKNEETGEIITVKLPDDERNAQLAALAYYAESLQPTVEDEAAKREEERNASSSENGEWNRVKNPFVWFWFGYDKDTTIIGDSDDDGVVDSEDGKLESEEKYGGYAYYKYLVNSGINATTYPTNTSILISNLGNMSDKKAIKIGNEYLEKIYAGTLETAYAARIIIFRGGETQSRAVLFGAEIEYAPKVEVKKYVTEINDTDGVYPVNTERGIYNIELTNPTLYSSIERNILTLDEKREAPVDTYAGTEVTYAIELHNPEEEAITGDYIDIPDKSYLEYVKGTASADDVTIQPGETITYTVTYRIKSSAPEGSISENRAVFVEDMTVSEEKLSVLGDDWDYVKIMIPDTVVKIDEEPTTTPIDTLPPTGKFNKHIVKVIKPNGTEIDYSRTDWSIDARNGIPVEVEKGDIVKFRIDFENTSNTRIDTLKFMDTMSEGLVYGDATSFMYEYDSSILGKTIASAEFDIKVTASNMLLQNLKNECFDFIGTWTRTITIINENKITITIKVELPTGEIIEKVFLEEEKEEESTSSQEEIKFEEGNGIDYVRLADPEIAGVVWVEGLDSQNGVKDENDNGQSGVIVKLYDENGDLEGETTTAEDGSYSFGRVQKGVTKISKSIILETEQGQEEFTGYSYKVEDGYKSYVVEFEYNGIKYESTVYTDSTGVTDTGTIDNWNNKSHACEANISITNRQDFNNKFETIAYNIAYDSENATNGKALVYDKEGHESILTKTNTTTIIAKSIDLFVKVSGGETECADDDEYLKHINLGLVEREQGDLSLKKDVMTAKLSINGHDVTYSYGSLGNNGYTGEYKLETPYMLNIYEADYNYRTENYGTEIATLKGGDSNDLNIELIYRVTITNDSDTFYSSVREVIDISSSSLTLISISRGNVNTSSTYNLHQSFGYEGYNTHYITGINDMLVPGGTISFDLSYKVNKVDGAIVLGEQANIAQIGAYSIYVDENGNTPAGVVDQDSNPGIINPDVIINIKEDDLYEDHCYYTSIIISLRPEPGTPPGTPTPPPSGTPTPDPGTPTPPPSGMPTPDPGDPPGGDPNYNQYRRITGNVWEDLNTETLGSGQKTGDGIKNNNENGAEKVIVVLLEVIEKDGKEYFVDTGITTKTDANGDYILNNIYTGRFVVRFIYGNDANDFTTDTGDTIRFSGQDYKSTVYTPAGTIDETEVIEVTAFRDTKNNSGSQVSVARDNELRRLEVIDYSTTMTYVKDNILKSQQGSITADELAANTSMFADTKKFNVQVEDPGNTTVTLSGNSETASGLIIYRYTINEVNFGLIERPITKLELMDDIKEITAVTASGDEILHIVFDIAYEWKSGRVARTVKINEVLSRGYENVQVLDRTNSTKGFRYVNIDSELLQGMKVTIKYQLAIANIGDIDTSNQNLIDMVKNYDVGNVVRIISNDIVNTQYVYQSSNLTNGSDVLKNYSYNNMISAVDTLRTSSYDEYRTIISDVVNDKQYELGYFLGSTYYDDYDSSTDKIVETRVDKILSYVDNDLVFKPEENLAEVVGGQAPKYLTYTIQEIRDEELLKGVDDSNDDAAVRELLSDPNGVTYISEDKNNLAFNIEDNEINPNLYKFLTPINEGTTINKDTQLYSIELEASRILASESDIDDIVLDNLAEIVKITNTVGRKAYINFVENESNKMTGYLGNTTDIVRDPDNDNPDDGEQDDIVSARETDTNFTETVTFSPPTGLTQRNQKVEKTRNTAIVVGGVIVLMLITGTGVVYLIKNKKFYK